MANPGVTVLCWVDADSDTYGVDSRKVQSRRNMEQHQLRISLCLLERQTVQTVRH